MTTHKASTKLVRLISARADAAYSLEAYAHFVAASESPFAEHCLFAMVVAYSRPFFENYKVGRILCDFPKYPDFEDAEMNLRHQRMLDIRNKFLAHSSAEGTRVMVVPPGVTNPITGLSRSCFDHNIGKRTFLDPRFVAWLAEVVYAFKGRLDAAVQSQLHRECDAQRPAEIFELETGWADFAWTENGEQDAPPNSRPPSPSPLPPDVQSSDSLRTPSSGGCG